MASFEVVDLWSFVEKLGTLGAVTHLVIISRRLITVFFLVFVWVLNPKNDRLNFSEIR
jgi:hypothetical protein